MRTRIKFFETNTKISRRALLNFLKDSRVYENSTVGQYLRVIKDGEHIATYDLDTSLIGTEEKALLNLGA